MSWHCNNRWHGGESTLFNDLLSRHKQEYRRYLRYLRERYFNDIYFIYRQVSEPSNLKLDKNCYDMVFNIHGINNAKNIIFINNITYKGVCKKKTEKKVDGKLTCTRVGPKSLIIFKLQTSNTKSQRELYIHCISILFLSIMSK
jgi:hypothetical protein